MARPVSNKALRFMEVCMGSYLTARAKQRRAAFYRASCRFNKPFVPCSYLALRTAFIRFLSGEVRRLAPDRSPSTHLFSFDTPLGISSTKNENSLLECQFNSSAYVTCRRLSSHQRTGCTLFAGDESHRR